MKITVRHKSAKDYTGDVLIVNLFQGVKTPGGATGVIDKALNGSISRLIKKGELSGKLGETVMVHTFGKLRAERVLIVGLGKKEQFDINAIRKAAAAAIQHAEKVNAHKVGTIVHGAGIGGIAPDSAAQAVAEGTILAQYRFTEFRNLEKTAVTECAIIEIDKKKIPVIQKGAKTGIIVAESQCVSRDLTNTPSNILTPRAFAQKIKARIKKEGLVKRIRYKVLDKTAMKKMGMGALLSVSQGSINDPCFITLRCTNPGKPLVCLIGKTVTFDSGGISLKPAQHMGLMKGDMSGGGVVFAVTLALARARARVNLLTIIPAVENMPSGSASRPGDVVTAMNGKTIEIISTDAEGRMTLADSLCYAEKMKAQTVIDIATLTGGCVVALGDVAAAVMGKDQKLIDELIAVSERTGERFWQLPLFEEYKKQIKSDIADLKNSGGRKASAITAGLFLQSFVDKARWVHIDIAGKEIAENAHFYTPKGGTGFGVRTLFEFVRQAGT
ncbi:MAG: leucyl aminopeptidase [candidate division WOR-3 bacterium]|nr:MAG: leucyl aminopeptidase [candidate division WOR-3 bacterium]